MSQSSQLPPDGREQETAAHNATLRLRNARRGAVEYGLEPWGEAYELQPGTTLTLISRGPSGEYIELVVEDARVTTWSDTGSTVTLFEGEQELGAGLASRLPVPRYPPGIGRPTLPLPSSPAYRAELVLHNDGGAPLALEVPSQSERYTLLAGTKCAVVVEGMTAGALELELSEGAVRVHNWDASHIVVLEEEEAR